MTTATISAKGWVVIPAELRKKYHLTPGDQITLVDYGGVLALVPQLSAPVEQAAGRFKGKTSLVQALMAERARERSHG